MKKMEELENGDIFVVKEIDIDSATLRRLIDIGIEIGKRLVVKEKLGSRTILVLQKEGLVALGKNIVQNVYVQKIEK